MTAETSSARAEIAGDLLDAMRRVLIRAVAHPEDDDADRKRNLYHIEHIARVAIAKADGEQCAAELGALNGGGE